MKIILIDQDGVLADLEKCFLQRWQQLYPEQPYISLENRNEYNIVSQYSKEFKNDILNIEERILDIVTKEGFFMSLPIIPEAREALEEMLDIGYEAFICTKPLARSKYCMMEKQEWVREYLGNKWVKRMIITRDKTLIKGDYLIDDCPDIKGKNIKPEWEHLLFQRPYNKNIKSIRTINWENWEEILSFSDAK